MTLPALAAATPQRGLTIAVIGAGTAGRSFALACANAGCRVILEDVMPARLRDAAAAFLQLGDAAQSGRSIELVPTVEDAVRTADIAIDFVPDELESKLEIFSMLDRMAPPRTILCTPSETLSITDLASCTYRPDRCLMLRGLSTTTPPRILHALGVSGEALAIVVSLLLTLGQPATIELDPDLPMLMKNMGYRPATPNSGL
jgi:3-hydroxybutyryl-CoA dehydrogenase